MILIYYTTYDSQIGLLTLVSNGKSLLGLWMNGQKYFLSSVKEDIIKKDDLEVFTLTKNWLNRYFAGDKPDISQLPLAKNGTLFQKLVWDLLCEIPYGKVTTYGEIAKKVAEKLNKPKMSSQAVGQAVGHNPIAIIIPCHRVIGSDKSLVGYAGGLDKKIKLLELEGFNVLDLID